MTITRDEIQRLRNSCREHANHDENSLSVSGSLNQAADKLDQLDACLARESIHTLYPGCPKESNGEEQMPTSDR